MHILLIILIAISLSMDTFSLSLAYGTLNLSNRKEKELSMIVGIFHFIMPLFGYYLGKNILTYINVDINIIAGIVFIILGIEMIISNFKEEEIRIITGLLSMIFFAFTVSLDSFSTGIGITAISNNVVFCSSIFSITSYLFTYIGLRLGNKISNLFSFTNLPTIIGACILLIIGINYLT